MKPNPAIDPLLGAGEHAMMIFMLAAAMTVAMLIATVFGLHQEAERARASITSKRIARRSARAVPSLLA